MDETVCTKTYIHEVKYLLSKDSEITYMLEKGQSVDSQDCLFITKQMKENNRMRETIIKEMLSCYKGTIDDIKVYTTVNTSELSSSLKKVVNKYKDENTRCKKLAYDENRGPVPIDEIGTLGCVGVQEEVMIVFHIAINEEDYNDLMKNIIKANELQFDK